MREFRQKFEGGRMRMLWRGQEIQDGFVRKMISRMNKATVHLVNYCRSLMKISSEGGRNPSKPGEPPHRWKGNLVSNVTSRVDYTGRTIKGWIGVRKGPVEIYAAALEFGTKSGRLAPRPYLRRTLLDNKERIRYWLIGR